MLQVPLRIPKPDAVAAEALEDTGAEVELGSKQTNAEKRVRAKSAASQRKTGDTGLSAAAGSGINIL